MYYGSLKPFPRPYLRGNEALERLGYLKLLSLVGIAALTYGLHRILQHFNFGLRISENSIFYSCILMIVYTPPVINALCFLLPVKPRVPSRMDMKPLRSVRKLHLCVVTRGTNVEAVRRSIDQMRHLSQYDSRVHLSIATDEPQDEHFKYMGANVVATPKSFKPKKAKYKARALEYFRLHMQLKDDDWVLHLDEETLADEHTVRACIDFAESQTKYEFGQGIILYNAHEYWKHKLLTVADMSRSRDDYARYYFAHNFVHRPIFGVHGSFLLTSGKVENAVCWDTDSLVEDYWFGLQAWGKGYYLGWIPSVVREQSPQTVTDYFKQRHRWFSGMWKLDSIFGKLTCIQWCSASIAIPFVAMCQWKFEVSQTVYTIILLSQASEIWSLLGSCILQDWDAGFGTWTTTLHGLYAFFIGIIAGWLETLIVIYSLFRPAKGFAVINKN